MVQSDKLVLILVFTFLIIGSAYSQERVTRIVELDQEEDYFVEVARGNIQGTFSVNKFGSNDAVGNSVEDVWSYGGVYNYLDIGNAQTVNVSSSSANDAWGGSNAWEVTIEGLDENYNLATEHLRLNGQSPNTSSTSFIRIHRAYVGHAPNGANAGDIYISYDTTLTAGVPTNTNNILGYINTDKGQTLMAQYTVPAGKKGYILDFYADSGGGRNVEIQFFVRPFNSSKRIKMDFDIFNSEFIEQYGVPFVVDEKVDIFIEAVGEQSTTRVSGGFDMIVIDQ
jgi:hypothetical protein